MRSLMLPSLLPFHPVPCQSHSKVALERTTSSCPFRGLQLLLTQLSLLSINNIHDFQSNDSRRKVYLELSRSDGMQITEPWNSPNVASLSPPPQQLVRFLSDAFGPFHKNPAVSCSCCCLSPRFCPSWLPVGVQQHLIDSKTVISSL